MIHQFHFHILPCSERERSETEENYGGWEELRLRLQGNHSWVIPAPLPSSLPDLCASPSGLGYSEAGKTWNFSSTALSALCSAGRAPSRSLSRYGLHLLMLQTVNPDIPEIILTMTPRLLDIGIMLMVSGRHRVLKLLGIILFF